MLFTPQLRLSYTLLGLLGRQPSWMSTLLDTPCVTQTLLVSLRRFLWVPSMQGWSQTLSWLPFMQGWSQTLFWVLGPLPSDSNLVISTFQINFRKHNGPMQFIKFRNWMFVFDGDITDDSTITTHSLFFIFLRHQQNRYNTRTQAFLYTILLQQFMNLGLHLLGFFWISSICWSVWQTSSKH